MIENVVIRMSRAYALTRNTWEQEQTERIGAFGYRFNWRFVANNRYHCIVELGGFYKGTFYPVREFEVGWKDETGQSHWGIEKNKKHFLYVRFFEAYTEGLFEIEEDTLHPLIVNSEINQFLGDQDWDARYTQEYAAYLTLPAEISLCRYIFGLTERPEGAFNLDRTKRSNH